MISWIQNSLQKHYKWFFVLLVVVLFVAFVLTIGNFSLGQLVGQGIRERVYFGYNLESPEWQAEQREAELSLLIRSGRPVRSQEQLSNYLMQRTAFLALADEIGLPAPSKLQLADHIREMRAFQGADGEYSEEAYERFLRQFRENSPETGALVMNALREDWRMNRVIEVVSGPGYALPQEARRQLQRERTQWTVRVGQWPYETFEPEINPTEEDLRAFYNENPRVFEEPEKVLVTTLQFPIDAYMAEVPPPAEEDLRAHFEQTKQRYRSPGPSGESVEPTYEEYADQVRADLVRSEGRLLARESAYDLIERIARQGITPGTPAYEALLEDFEVKVRDLEPYARGSAPSGSLLNENQLAEAFELNETYFYSNSPLQSITGEFVLLLRGRIEPTVPPFEEVRADVEYRYEARERRERFNEAGREKRAALQEALAAGTPFEEAAEAEGLAVITYADFTREETATGLPEPVLEALDRLQEGDVGPMLFHRSTGLFPYVASREVPADIPQEDLEATYESIASRSTAYIGQRTVEDRMEAELARAGLQGQ